jgi:hypothetical protein
MRKRKRVAELPDALWREIFAYFLGSFDDMHRLVICSKGLRSVCEHSMVRHMVNIRTSKDTRWLVLFPQSIGRVCIGDLKEPDYVGVDFDKLAKVWDLEIIDEDLQDATFPTLPRLTRLKLNLVKSENMRFEPQPSLEILDVTDLSKDVMYSARVTFPKLVQLLLTKTQYMCLPNLQSLRTLTINKQTSPELGPQMLSQVTLFKLKNCPTVASFAHLQLPKLEQLVIENCPKLSISSRNNFPALRTITIVRASIMQRSQANASRDMHWSYSPEDDTLTSFRK